MKKVKFLGLNLLVLLFSAASAFGQSRVVLDQSANAVAFTNDNKNWGLEVNGVEIISPKFKTIGFQNGLFKVKGWDGDWMVIDKDGSDKVPNWVKASDVKISEKFVLFEKHNGGTEALIYDRATWEVVKAKEITYDDMYKQAMAANADKGTSFDPTSAQQKIAVKQAEAASAAVPFGAFSFRTNSEGKQELIVDGKIMFTADSFDLFLDESFRGNSIAVTKNVDWYKISGRWAFRVETASWNRSKYGLYVLDINDKDGQKVVEGKLSIPIKYQGVWHHTNSGYAKCDLGGFKEEYRNFNGVLMDLTTRKPKE
ncbi:MAG: hypothetical protein LBL90_08405 [Prevotellaceae bacterium]|nr:hypothetical protein [Prevotellaceae bacterium]